jgi:hypothetical protein
MWARKLDQCYEKWRQAMFDINSLGTNKDQLLHRIQSVRTIHKFTIFALNAKFIRIMWLWTPSLNLLLFMNTLYIFFIWLWHYSLSFMFVTDNLIIFGWIFLINSQLAFSSVRRDGNLLNGEPSIFLWHNFLLHKI